MSDIPATRGFSLKDQLFNQEKVRYLGGLFASAQFDAEMFEAKVMENLLDLELTPRITLIATVFESFLPEDFSLAAMAIEEAIPAPLDPDKIDDDFGDFIFAPLGEYVVRNGLDAVHLPTSLPLLRELTKRFSVEFSIRHFLNAWPEETMTAMQEWVKDENYHVRRLVSEGTRPTLPWGKKIGLEVTDPLPFLNILHADQTRFVTRSVANHMNDISKKQPELVVETLKKWRDEGSQDAAEMDWMTRHSLRTLVKKGHTGALEMLGFHENPSITVSEIALSPSNDITIGEVGTFAFEITAKRDENLLIDYAIDFVKKNGSTAPKVFKLKKLSLKKGETVKIEKKHRFLKGSTTFTHYPGDHRFNLQINGTIMANHDFTLSD